MFFLVSFVVETLVNLFAKICLLQVMLESGKYDRVYEFFRKMKSSGEAPKAITYKGSYLYFGFCFFFLCIGNLI